MAQITYFDFDLLIEQSGEGYRARVLDSPAGQATADFRLPFSDLELENFLLRIGRPRPGVRHQKSPEAEAARAFGSRLFEATFDGEMYACLRRSLDEADRRATGLRIRLHLVDAPELAGLPWEFLYYPVLNRFFVLSTETPLVRYLDLPRRPRPLAVELPLRMLVLTSSPHGYPPLAVDREWINLTEALSDALKRGLVRLERLAAATLPALQQRLQHTEYHILHYIGHGYFDQRNQEGTLLLEDEAGRGQPVTGPHLSTVLHDHRALRLVILNACEGGRALTRDPFAGVAQSLVQQAGVPAVIAMQFDVTDEAAITCAQWFYTALADGRPVDAALAEARKAIFAQSVGVEWGTPVLYMASPDGQIFDIDLETHIGDVERATVLGPTPASVTSRALLDVPSSNLPVPVTSLIGRKHEMAEIKRRLSEVRLITLTGAGGCGKTRLALEVARELVDAYDDGVWLVELGALEDPQLVPQAVAEVVGVVEGPGRSLIDTLTDHLRSREMLLVLDNCEHLIDACATLVAALLRACPDLRILITSREPLSIHGELIWVVPPLSLPNGLQRLPPLAELAQYEAIHLFAERAQLSRPGFELTPRNALAVAQICRQLDGIPLALEMAAARVRVLSVEQIAVRLEDRFRLLTRGGRTDLPHHQTLRAMVDWSYALLSVAERVLFNRLSVFAGGFTLEAAEAIGPAEDLAAGSRPASEIFNVLDLLSRLIDKSLIVVEERRDGALRYRMLETLRQYGQERLAASHEMDVMRRQHATYFLALAEAAQPQLSGPEQVSWLGRLEVEHDNLRAALGWAQRSGEVETGLRLGEALWSFWAIRGYYSEGRRWLAALLVLERPVAPAVQAKAIHAAGVLAYAQGDYAAARSLHEEGLAIHQRLDDKRGIAYALNRLGAVAHDQGDYDMARAHWEKSLAIRQGLGDARSIAISNHNLGVLAHKQGDLATARARFEESLRMWRALEDKQNIAGPLYMLGGVARDEGDHESARVCFEESLTLWREVGHRQGVSASLSNLGDLARDKGDYQTAQTLFEESLAISRELEDQPGIAKSLDTLGDVACDRGDYDAARGLYEESLVMWKRLGDKRKVAASLERFVGLVVAQGHPARALRLAGAAAALRETIDAPPPPSEQARLDRRLDTARQALGEEAANHALADGREMTMEQAIACALEGV